jgi:two-component system chemotaxis sensor kinase CheA
MIIDPNGVLARTGRVDTSAANGDMGHHMTGIEARTEKLALLLVRAGSGMLKAIPLDLIARLEEIQTDVVFHSNGHMLIKYRDRLMPLIAADPEVSMEPGSRKQVLVISEGERSMGLVVDEIEDIVESAVVIELETGRPEVIGSSLVNGQPTEIVNTGHFLTLAAQDWFKPTSLKSGPRGKRVLMVDDSAFFRSLMLPVMRSCGLEVVPAASGEDALSQLEAGERVDLVITDIEMPGISGFELARRLKSEARWQNIPIIGLSGHADQDAIARGTEAGFVRHLPKLARDGIAEAINEIMQMETEA